MYRILKHLNSRYFRTIFLSIAFLLLATVAFCTDYYVNASTGNNIPANGTSANPWKTVTYALSHISGAGHTVYVATGTYDTALGESFPILMKNGVSIVGSGIDLSIIDAGGTNTVIRCVGIVDASTKIDGFTIKGGGGVSQGAGFYISAGSTLMVSNNKISNNSTSTTGGLGGGLYIINSSPIILNNIISSNSVDYGYGAGIYITNSSPLVKGNKIIGNGGSSFNNDYCQGLYSTSSGKSRIVNNIIASNHGSGINCYSPASIINNTISFNGYNGIYISSATPDSIINNIISDNNGYGIYESNSSSDPGKVWYNLFNGNALGLYRNEGTTNFYSANQLNTNVTECKNNIDGDPLFIDKINGNYHENTGSPVIDIGDPNSQYSNEPLPNGSRINIGAYGNTAEAAITSLPPVFPVSIYVNAVTGNNSSGDGTSANPWKTITYALSRINDSGHTIYVASGTYNTSLGETFPIQLKNGISIVGAGIDLSIIDAGGTNTVVKCVGIVDASTTIDGFTIKGGGGVSQGAGFYISAGSTLMVSNNKISNNSTSTTGGLGGGLYIINSSPAILNNTISSNSVDYGYGAGIYITNSSPLIEGNKIIGNGGSSFSTDYCQGLYSTSSGKSRIVNNIIASNHGSGINCYSPASIINNTISFNGYNGIYISSATPDSIINNIISDNNGYGIYESNSSSDPGKVWYNLFNGNALGLYRNEGTTNFYSANQLNTNVTECKNNIDGDPLFIDKINGNYHENTGSPVIDIGDPNSQYSNEPLPNGSRINIGAYGNTAEAAITSLPPVFPVSIYVNAVTGNNSSGDGTSANPWKTITYALSRINDSGHTIYVASGTYNTSSGETFPIQLKNGISIVGAGIDLSIIDAGGTNTVVKCVGIVDASTKIDGFTIKGGGGVSQGAGLYISAGSALMVSNNKISNNSTNTTGGLGGGLYIINSSPTLLNNIISSNNIDYGYGAGMYITNSSPLIQGNKIIGNESSSSSTSYGQGLYCTSSGKPRIINNIIAYNHSAGISCYSSASIINNTISYNGDNGISISSATPDSIINNIISDNTGYGIYESNSSSDPGKVWYNLFNGNTLGLYRNEGTTDYYSATSLNTGVSESKNNIDGDPMFADQANSDYHLQTGSPAIDAGDPNSPLDSDCTRADIGALPTFNSSYTLTTSVSISVPGTTNCQNSTVTFTATAVNGGSSPIYQWKNNGSNVGTNSSTYSTTTLSNGDVISCIMTSSISCTTGNPATSNSISITVNPLPDTAGTISGTGTVCAGTSNVNYSVPAITNATSYIWTLPGGATGSSTTNSISVSFGSGSASGNITVKGNNSCGDGTPSTYTVTVNPLPVAAGTITGTPSVCPGQSSVSYSIPAISYATSYSWNYSGTGATIVGTTNSVTVSFSNSATSGNLTVNGTNICGDGTISSYSVTVNPLPDPAGSISGMGSICQITNNVIFSIPAITNATSYIWTIPGGATGSSTTNNISVNFGLSSVSDNITVKGRNSCGDGLISTFFVTVHPLPGAAGSITGTSTVCLGQNSVSYSVPAIDNSTNYNWYYSGTGATINGTGNSININFSNTATSGNLSVKGNNSCGDGIVSTNYPITVNYLPPTVGAITQPTCTIATGSVVLNDLPATGTWTLTRTPGGTITTGTGTSTTISELASGTYTWTVTFESGCTSVPSANAVINNQPSTPAAPIPGDVTPPTCSVPTGSVVLSGLPATGTWTLIRTPGGTTTTGTGTSTTISGLAVGTYTWTVANASGCTSVASANVVINANPAIPAAPTPGTITQPTCTVATGSVVLNDLPATGTWTLTKTPGGTTTTGTGTSTTISGLAANTYTWTVTNATGCTSASSVNVVINTQPVTPTAPITGTITQPTCSVSTGSVILNSLPSSGTWTLTKTPGGTTTTGTGISTTISGLTAGSYTYTVTNSSGCTSVSSANIVINAQPATPTAPIAGTITQPTCSVSTGSVIFNSLPSSGTWTLTKTPGGTTTTGTGTSTTVSGIATGTYTYTVTNSSGCISVTSANVVINSQPVTPTAPTQGTITQPTCSVPTGSVVLNGLPAMGNWTITTNPGGITTSGTGTSSNISGLAGGTYTFTVTNASGCISVASANVVITASPSTPTVPTSGIVTQPKCSLPTGSVILNSLPSSGTWTLTITPGGTTTTGTGTTKTISGLSSGTYTYTVTNASGCTSLASANIVIEAVKPGLVPKIKIKWNDVLLCLNRADSISSYLWYNGSSTVSGTNVTGRYYITNKQSGIYKLQTTDKDGCTNFSNAITIPTGTKSISVYPNPARDNIAVSMNDEILGKAVISIINVTGKKVLEIETEKEFTDLYKVIPVSGLDEGTYLLRIVLNRENVFYTKIIIIK